MDETQGTMIEVFRNAGLRTLFQDIRNQAIQAVLLPVSTSPILTAIGVANTNEVINIGDTKSSLNINLGGRPQAIGEDVKAVVFNQITGEFNDIEISSATDTALTITSVTFSNAFPIGSLILRR
jgi:hypothetical protein